MENYIYKLAEIVDAIKYEKLPQDVIEKAKLCIIDDLECCMNSMNDERGIAALESIPKDRGNSTIFGMGYKADAADAVKEAEKMISQIDDKEAGRRKHILVVDDDSSVLKLIKSYLSGNYDVATAKSGKVALKFLETKKTDLVLLDYEMPGEKGPEVLSKIRADARTKNLPVVFLTGVTDKEKIQDVLAMKPQGYLLKPIDMMKLSSTIKNVLS